MKQQLLAMVDNEDRKRLDRWAACFLGAGGRIHSLEEIWSWMSERYARNSAPTLLNYPGLYFVFEIDGSLRYIGSSNNLRVRLDHHRRTAREFLPGRVRLFVTPGISLSALVRLEAAYIYAHAPSENRTPPWSFRELLGSAYA